MIGDVSNVAVTQARVECVAHGTDTHDAVPVIVTCQMPHSFQVHKVPGAVLLARMPTRLQLRVRPFTTLYAMNRSQAQCSCQRQAHVPEQPAAQQATHGALCWPAAYASTHKLHVNLLPLPLLLLLLLLLQYYHWCVLSKARTMTPGGVLCSKQASQPHRHACTIIGCFSGMNSMACNCCGAVCYQMIDCCILHQPKQASHPHRYACKMTGQSSGIE
jgi:hypothetical protein